MVISVDFEVRAACAVGACLVPRETGCDAALVGGQARDSLGVACWCALLSLCLIKADLPKVEIFTLHTLQNDETFPLALSTFFSSHPENMGL